MAYRSLQISPVQWALRDTSNILGEGLEGLGRQKMRNEELGLRRALQERQLVREGEQDVRAKERHGLELPSLKMKSEEDQRKLKDLDSDLTIGRIFGDNYALQFGLNVSKNDPSGLMPVQKIANVLGARYDTDEQSPNRGKFVREDGTPVKVRDFEGKWKEVSEIIKSNLDPDEATADHLARKQDALKYYKAQGMQENDPKLKALQTDIAKAKSLLSDPEKRLVMLQKHRDAISKFNNDDAKREVALIDHKIDKLETQIHELKKTAVSKESDLTKMLYQESRKDARAKLSADTRLKAAEKVAGTKEKKLSPQDAAEVKILQNEYNSNLKVIEAYRKGDELVTPQKAAAARRNNVTIAKKLKTIGLPETEIEKKNLDPLGLFEDEEEEE